MRSAYERRLIVEHCERLARHIDRTSLAARGLVTWLRRHEGLVDLRIDDIAKGAGRRAAAAAEEDDGAIFKAQPWRRLLKELRRAAAALRSCEADQLAVNLAALCEAFRLDAVDRRIAEIVIRAGLGGPFRKLCESVLWSNLLDSDGLISLLIDEPQETVWHRLRRGALRTSGVIVAKDVYAPKGLSHGAPAHLLSALLPPNEGIGDIEGALMGPPLTSDLKWQDFDHVGSERDLAAALLRAAAQRREKGVNILLYGPVGTGKTELCKLLAAEAGLTLHGVGERDEFGDEPCRYDRLSALKLGQRIAAYRGCKVLLFDEMEDLVTGGSWASDGEVTYTRAPSKVFLNRLLESNRAPLLWTANSARLFDPSLLRRMSLAIELRVPPARIRERVWRRQLALQGLDGAAQLSARLADELPVAGGIISSAVRTAKLTGGDGRSLRRAATALAKAVRHGRPLPPALPRPASFEAGLLNADCDLARLTERLSAPDLPLDFSLCLYGPPGTGKTAFVRNLAERLGLDVLQKRASDLLSKWLGESEQKIATAFAEARAHRQFLIFDEADSLLCTREEASRSWEVSQVNEMLTWMEVHDLPFACTTNLMERLDEASLRRFTFKVKLDFLTAEQAGRAFRHYFGITPPVVLAELDGLTPGDFAVVAKKLRYMEKTDVDAASIAGLLRQESAAKRGFRRPIGFLPAPR